MIFESVLEKEVNRIITEQNQKVIQYKKEKPNSIFLKKQEFCLYLERNIIEFLLEYFFAKHLNQLISTHGIAVISEQLLFLPILKGGVYLESVIKKFSRLHFIETEFVGVKSYNDKIKTKENIYLNCTKEQIANKHLILIDEIVDSGKTLQTLIQLFLEKKPASINIFIAINKLSKEKYQELSLSFKKYGVFTTAICFPTDLWAAGTLLGLDANQKCRATLDDLFIASGKENWTLGEENSKNPYNIFLKRKNYQQEIFQRNNCNN